MKHERAELIEKLKEHFGVKQNNHLAEALGGSKHQSWQTKIATWPKSPKKLSVAEILTLVKDAVAAAAKRQEEKAKEEREKISKTFIEPIVEYFPIEKVESKQGKNYEISPPAEKKKDWERVRGDLEKEQVGVYIFYNSSGRAIYVGKTGGRTITLWARMKLSLNHDQQKSRQLYRIADHGANAKPPGKTLKPGPVQLHELAKYFSAYKVHPEMLHNVEALLVRAFADNLMNKKMETFKN